MHSTRVGPVPTPAPAAACGAKAVGRPVTERIPLSMQGWRGLANGRCVRPRQRLPSTPRAPRHQRPCLLTATSVLRLRLYENFRDRCRALRPMTGGGRRSIDGRRHKHSATFCSSFLGTAGSGVVLSSEDPASFKVPPSVLNVPVWRRTRNLRFGTGFHAALGPT